MKKRAAITLIEILIVMLLIGIITATLAYNYQGGLKKASEFKSNADKQRIKGILSIYLAEHPENESSVSSNWASYCASTGLVDQNTTDKWQPLYSVSYQDSQITVDDIHSK